MSTPVPAGAQWTLELPLPDLEGTQRLAHRLAEALGPGDLLVLTGGLGAGKTTFTQALGESLGVHGRISSPTFVLARIHRSSGGPDLVHVDAYRTDAEGMESLDLHSTAPDSVTVVEWGRGVVEASLAGEGGSWLDLELLDLELLEAEPPDREPLELGGADPEPSSTASRPEHGGGPGCDGAGRDPASDPAWPGIITDFSESAQDLLGSPRRAVLRGYGARWAEPPDL